VVNGLAALEVHEALFALVHQVFHDELELGLCRGSELVHGQLAHDVMDLVALAFADVDFGERLQKDAGLRDEFEKREVARAYRLHDGRLAVAGPRIKRIAVRKKI